MPRSKDRLLVHLSEDVVLMHDPEVDQYILAKVITKARGDELQKIAFWRDGLDKLGREIRRRESYMRLSVTPESVKTVPLEIFFMQSGEKTRDELVYG